MHFGSTASFHPTEVKYFIIFPNISFKNSYVNMFLMQKYICVVKYSNNTGKWKLSMNQTPISPSLYSFTFTCCRKIYFVFDWYICVHILTQMGLYLLSNLFFSFFLVYFRHLSKSLHEHLYHSFKVLEGIIKCGSIIVYYNLLRLLQIF